MQIHLQRFALALVPDRREIGRADAFLRGKFLGREIKIGFQWIECVDPARAPFGLFGDEVQAIAQRQNPFTHVIDAVKAQNQTIDKRQIVQPLASPDYFDLTQDVLGSKSPVLSRREEKSHEGAEIERVRGHRRIDFRLALRGFPDRSGMAKSAVQPNHVETQVTALRHADWKSLVFLKHESDGLPSFTRRRQLILK